MGERKSSFPYVFGDDDASDDVFQKKSRRPCKQKIKKKIINETPRRFHAHTYLSSSSSTARARARVPSRPPPRPASSSALRQYTIRARTPRAAMRERSKTPHTHRAPPTDTDDAFAQTKCRVYGTSLFKAEAQSELGLRFNHHRDPPSMSVQRATLSTTTPARDGLLKRRARRSRPSRFATRGDAKQRRIAHSSRQKGGGGTRRPCGPIHHVHVFMTDQHHAETCV